MNDWISTRAGENDVWIAANDITKEGVWNDISDDFENWLNGEPNQQGDEDCASISSYYDGQWVDISCDHQIPCFACQCKYI